MNHFVYIIFLEAAAKIDILLSSISNTFNMVLASRIDIFGGNLKNGQFCLYYIIIV